MKKVDTEEIRLRTLLEKRAMPKAELDEMLSLFEQSDCPMAQAWRMRNEEFEAESKRTSEELSRQGRMTAERKRYLALSAKRMCDMTCAEHKELARLSEKSNCPEAKHHREATKKCIDRALRHSEANEQMLRAAGVPSWDEMTDEEKAIGTYFRTTPDELAKYITTMDNHRRGLSVLPAHELEDTRATVEKESRRRKKGSEATHAAAVKRAEEIRRVYRQIKADNPDTDLRTWFIEQTVEHFQGERKHPRKGYGIRTVGKATKGL